MDVEQRLGYLVKRLEQAVTAATVAAVAPHGLTVTEFAVLSVLAQRPGSTNAELARDAFVSPQAMHRVLTGLERRALLVRQPGAGRTQPARLSPTGRALHARADADVTVMEGQLTAAVGADHAAELAQQLKAMTTSLRLSNKETPESTPLEHLSDRAPEHHQLPSQTRG